MPIDPARLRNWPIPDIEQSYTERDTMLYALGVGYGDAPLDAKQLRYVYEQDLQVLPSMSVVLGYPGFWLGNEDTGVDWRKVLHGEQGFEIFKPLPPKATVVGRSRVTGLFDKGAGKGAVLLSERDVVDKATGDLLCRLTSTTMLRGDGGFGGPSGPLPVPHALPERAPDLSLRIATSPRAALLYRLSGDYNPLHADPEVARKAGFDKPILHGLCSFGVVCRALVELCCDGDPTRLTKMQVRFSSPVYPGETIVTEVWKDAEGRLSFRAKVAERDVVVINNGLAAVS
ncbi:3-alpha,7-alpha,12-alpha-trihydroxy-5-beta-cholest-24-enoyl-CoA hydratase [Rhodopseudomonas sp. BR0C11]|uniref:MaoC/PaaZ C-terminal domain-containing protein n=1 Tax=Rhodopseudomonas sp. BR0C11 TaxID=2269370 RepID=UPI0013DEDFE6|nr:MaoC/PaaZ C-terminal domain-containing protein [Rhodopseudomonas sp. BR0C11]NEV77638.1 3-alpha,7-alpha,12-alpha-trihydroxy-5-beta-cholest-24-enoyl-CoA hydratase [Rhodopseudomonas sp. BR0C11]